MSIVRPFISIPTTLAEWDRFLRDATVGDGEITDRKLRDSVGLSVIGRSVNSTGTPSDIQATGSDEFLVTRSGVLGFGGIVDNDLPDTISRDYTVSVITASTTATANSVILANATSGAINVILPVGESSDIIHVKKTDSSSNSVTVTGTIDGYSSIVISLQYQSYHLLNDGTQWWII